jgi:hypothetical protein
MYLPILFHFSNHSLSCRDSDKVEMIIPVHIVHTGCCGHPCKYINSNWMVDAMSTHRKMTLKTLVEAINVHPNTLHHQLRMHDLYRCFSKISAHDIDILIRHYIYIKPNSRMCYVMGFLKRHSLRVQKTHVQMALQRMDGLGQALHIDKAID